MNAVEWGKDLYLCLQIYICRMRKRVVLKSPHVPHHVMSEAEERLYSAQRKNEGAAFKRLSQSPDNVSNWLPSVYNAHTLQHPTTVKRV